MTVKNLVKPFVLASFVSIAVSTTTLPVFAASINNNSIVTLSTIKISNRLQKAIDEEKNAETKKMLRSFDAKSYGLAYPDVVRAYGTDTDKLLTHFLQYGRYESRLYHPAYKIATLFDVTYYRELHPELKDVTNTELFQYYMTKGIKNLESPNPTIDISKFKNLSPEQAFNKLQSYLMDYSSKNLGLPINNPNVKTNDSNSSNVNLAKKAVSTKTKSSTKSSSSNQSTPTPTTENYSIVATATNGGTVTGSNTYLKNANVVLEAHANSNYHFVKWTENGNSISTNSTITFKATTNRTLVAVFEQDNNPGVNTFSVQISCSEGGTLAIDSATSGNYNSGSSITIKSVSTNDEEYLFSGWINDDTKTLISSSEVHTFAVTESVNLKAIYYSVNNQPTSLINTSVNNESYGSISTIGYDNTQTNAVNKGTSVILIANAASGYEFLHWEDENGNVISEEQTVSFNTINNEYYYCAVFQEESSNDQNTNDTNNDSNDSNDGNDINNDTNDTNNDNNSNDGNDINNDTNDTNDTNNNSNDGNDGNDSNDGNNELD